MLYPPHPQHHRQSSRRNKHPHHRNPSSSKAPTPKSQHPKAGVKTIGSERQSKTSGNFQCRSDNSATKSTGAAVVCLYMCVCMLVCFCLCVCYCVRLMCCCGCCDQWQPKIRILTRYGNWPRVFVIVLVRDADLLIGLVPVDVLVSERSAANCISAEARGQPDDEDNGQHLITYKLIRISHTKCHECNLIIYTPGVKPVNENLSAHLFCQTNWNILPFFCVFAVTYS